MSKNRDLSDADQHIFKDSIIWEKLYSFLVVRVRYWVYSAQLSLWHGKEEEIAGDIVQDAIVGTLTYTSQYSHRACEKEPVLSKSLLHISAAIAYQYYQVREGHDSRFIVTQLRNFRAQGYVAVDEQIDWQEMAIASAFQEWYCECLVGMIMKIPRSPRQALLAQLANRVRLGSQPTRLLLSAFLKRDVHLQDYQQSLPRNPRERNKHKALLQLAYGQIMKGQQQENHELLSESKDFPSFISPEFDDRKIDLVLTSLVARLEATAPSPRPELGFRENLRDKLLDMMIEHQVSRTTAAPADQTGESFSSFIQPLNDEEVHRSDELPSPDFFDAADDHTDTDDELAVLIRYLGARAPLAAIDPVFRETLCEKLKDIPKMYAASQTVENSLDETERLIEKRRLPDVQENRQS